MIDEKKIDIIKSSRPFKVWDLIFIGVIIALTVIFIIVSLNGNGDYVRITYDGQNTEYPLYIDREINIENKITILIKDGLVYVKSSDCPDKICIHTGAVSRQNQTIVCAPFGVVIKIISTQSDWI